MIKPEELIRNNIILKQYLDTKYFINNNGNIINNNTSIILKGQNNGNGYLKITLTIEGKQIQRYIHRLVALSFIPNPENKPQVNHLNGIKTDNRVENLEWCTNSENQIHAHKNGLKKNGNKVWNGKFSKNDIHIIKEMYNSGIKQIEISKKMNVCKSTICEILQGKRYKYN